MIYLRMAWRSLLQSRGLTAVMIAALALGIATWYVQHQTFVFLDGKTPVAREGLYQVALEREARPQAERVSLVTPLVPSVMLTLRDAQGVFAGSAPLHAITFGAPALLEPDGAPAETTRVRYATRDLFALFEVPFAEGGPWSSDDEAVIDERLARRLFGDASAVGRRVRLDGADLRVVGVVAGRYADRYHLYERFVPGRDEVYLPLANAAPAHANPDFQHVVAGGEAGVASVWVELRDDAARAAFVRAAEAHLARERAAGRAATPRAVTLRSAEAWRAAFEPGGIIALWPLLAAMCLSASVLNLIRMLMAKFAGRGHDLGLMRALGARRRSVMGQLLLEAMLIGLFAAVCGLVLGIAMMPLAASSLEGTHGTPTTISANAVFATLGVSVAAALLAALYPAWRLSRGTPAALLRVR